MKPIEFEQQNIVYAKDQKEYLPLPSHKSKSGVVTSCWKMSFKERLTVLFTGRVYCSLWAFYQPLQPQELKVKFNDE